MQAPSANVHFFYVIDFLGQKSQIKIFEKRYFLTFKKYPERWSEVQKKLKTSQNLCVATLLALLVQVVSWKPS